MSFVEEIIQREIHKSKEFLRTTIEESVRKSEIYKINELEEALFLLKIAKEYNISRKSIKKIVKLPDSNSQFSSFHVVDDNESDDKLFWTEVNIENSPLLLNSEDIIFIK
ncbi:hypothetical protein [Capnocytophaga stomatis]|uniref:Uncharacterized protein n=1 Tax=Capnocytophaga stomatis TaxID=1848904 RepID=A0A250FYK7_9FLAO|nr:hypothetical protein [Capnocytophaga stomatis]ATA89168.1 hypothetical protein CGC58_05195 [Capnocytophaga stomatis]GIJ93996.1 hypothetical protein CAPN002_12140 [Capnocytophaga stomatis]GIJ96756.1 hypothetical protein CAPN001_13250 [Capnocytophaga stomatis]